MSLSLLLGGALAIIVVWAIAFTTEHFTTPGATLISTMIVTLCLRETRARHVIRVVFQLGYRIGHRDARALDGAL